MYYNGTCERSALYEGSNGTSDHLLDGDPFGKLNIGGCLYVFRFYEDVHLVQAEFALSAVDTGLWTCIRLLRYKHFLIPMDSGTACSNGHSVLFNL